MPLLAFLKDGLDPGDSPFRGGLAVSHVFSFSPPGPQVDPEASVVPSGSDK